MCGIAGQFSGEVARLTPAPVGAMVEALRDRGPDHQAVWSGDEDRGVVLGHSRLSIIDRGERSHQPMVGDRWAITYNGEIFNFKELRKELHARGAVFTTEGDTEVILRGLETWGLSATIDRLAGMFALGIYDRQEREIHLVRDRLGIKPLYYHEQDGVVTFASNPAAIVEGLGASAGWHLNRDALYGFFMLGATVGRESLIDGIQSLGAAEMITWTGGGERVRHRYWTPQPRHADLGELLHTVVDEHRIADVPLAVFLSGGVDSSVLAVLLRDVDCFHLRSEEVEMARHVCEKIGTGLEICEPTRTVDHDQILDRFAASSGECCASATMPSIVSEKIRQAGYTVAFSANGADEIFCGYPRTPTPEMRSCFLPPNGYDVPSYDCLSQQVRHIFRSPENFSVPGSRCSTDPLDLSDSLIEASHLPAFPPSASYRWLECQSYVLQDLNPTLDFSSMAHSLEVRVPFLDHRVVEAGLSLEATEHVASPFGRKSRLKKILSEAGLHPSVWARPKVGFSLPQDSSEAIHAVRVQAVEELHEGGFLKVDISKGNVFRDFRYLSSAAHAFVRWKRVWIDSGIVSA